ncbi:hypothetical protein [Clostridium brassicae]|uniref:Uncharacterized protein n=1 Tax=Clostridium brassicae TaxID=2999072 RepID=A0ABT4D430_9CLOT|nr:hypothetical protein [Clostridium brassicae]MCY6957035.1 hypothetical protein [Clostridium brassicae]
MLKGIINLIYFKFRKKEIKKARYRLRRLKIGTILNIIMRNCKEKQITCNVIEENRLELIVELIGKKEKVLLKYDRRDMIFHDEYYNFVANLKKIGVEKGVYITCGLFEGNIHGNRNIFHKQIALYDYAYFIKNQLGLRGKTIDVFRNRKINFFRYLPK